MSLGYTLNLREGDLGIPLFDNRGIHHDTWYIPFQESWYTPNHVAKWNRGLCLWISSIPRFFEGRIKVYLSSLKKIRCIPHCTSRYTTTCLWGIPGLFEKATLVYPFSILVVYSKHLGKPLFVDRGIHQTMLRSGIEVVLSARGIPLHVFGVYLDSLWEGDCGIPLFNTRGIHQTMWNGVVIPLSTIVVYAKYWIVVLLTLIGDSNPNRGMLQIPVCTTKSCARWWPRAMCWWTPILAQETLTSWSESISML